MRGTPVIISACLLGLRTRYDGGDAFSKDVAELSRGRHFIPVCPEQLGGLPTPRPASEIEKGGGGDVLDGRSRVLDEHGSDATREFLKGAEEALKIARLSGAKEAYLKEKSPSCGVNSIKRDGKIIEGAGVTAALLAREGLVVKGF